MASAPHPTLFDVFRAVREGHPLSTIRQIMANPFIFQITGLFDHIFFRDSAKVHFDAVATDYVSYAIDQPYMVEAMKWQMASLPQAIARLADIGTDRPIFISDYGAGAGALSSWPVLNLLLARFRHRYPTDVLFDKKIRLKLFDISPAMKYLTRDMAVETLPNRLKEMFEDHCADIVRIIKRAQYFDHDVVLEDPSDSPHILERQHIIICSFVFHHLSLRDKYDALARIRSRLRDDGLLIFIDEYRTHAEQIGYLDSLVALSAERGQGDIPYGLESFVDSLWYTEVTSSRIRFHSIARTGTADGKLIAFIFTPASDIGKP